MIEKTYDLGVIGTGPGGYVAAIRASQLGMKVICIEKRPLFGGTCLNVGCIPSKHFLDTTHYYHFLQKQGENKGIYFSDLSADLKKMKKGRQETILSLAKGISSLFRKNRIDTIQGQGRLVDPHQIEVLSEQKKQRVFCKNILLACGSQPMELPFLPFDQERVLSSSDIFSLETIPSRLLVIGAGIIGLELGSCLKRLGSEVIFFEFCDRICPFLDKTSSETLEDIFKEQGYQFHLNTEVIKGERTPSGILLEFKSPQGKIQKQEGDYVLVSVGRRPYTQGLGLESLGITCSDQGHIRVNHYFQTKYSHIYAVGDVIDGPMLAHKASEEAVACVEKIASMHPKINYVTIPKVIYTDPELASVGLTQEEAEQASLSVRVGTFPFKGNSRANICGCKQGLVKLVAEKNSDRLLGMHIVGPGASEMIQEGVVALEKGVTLGELAYFSHSHPGYSEAIKEAALAAHGRSIHL